MMLHEMHIHSYMFFFGFDENEKIDSFFVSSEFDRNKMLYRIELKDWIAYMEFVGSDSVVALDMRFDVCKKDYVITKKGREDNAQLLEYTVMHGDEATRLVEGV